MKFLLFLILPIASISELVKCYKEQKLEKKSSFNTTSSYTVLYLDNDFSDDYLYFEVTVYNGYFYYDDVIFYSFRNEIFGDEISSNTYIFLESSAWSYKSNKINYHDGIYDKYTTYYKIPRKKNYKYVYFYYPVFRGNYLIVKNIVTLSTGSKVGIVLGSISFLIILIILIIIIYRLRIKRRKHNNKYPTSGYNSKMDEYNYPNNPPKPISNYPTPSDFQPDFPSYQPNYSSTQSLYNSTESKNMPPAEPLQHSDPSSSVY